MVWLNNAIPHVWQWIGFFATLIGTGLALWAALAAKGARRQALEAKEAAIRIGRLFHVSDLVADMQELQSIINEKNEVLVAAKADMIRGRVGRFLEEWKTSQRPESHGEHMLSLVRLQLENISKEAVGSRRMPKNQWSRIQIAFGEANQALQTVAGIQKVEAQET